MGSCWITWVASNSNDKYPSKRQKPEKSTAQRKGKVNLEARLEVWSQNQEHPNWEIEELP